MLEPLFEYLLLGEKLYTQGNAFAQSFNFGPNENGVSTVGEVAKKIIELHGEGELVINKTDDLHEANLLMLSIEKAKNILGWVPRYSLDKALEQTVLWYKEYYRDGDMRELSLKQIEEFENFLYFP